MIDSPHCSKCTSTYRCGGYHLYVIELDYELVINRRFMSRNRKHIKDMDCLYVGSTSHTCVCRFKQHQYHAKKNLEGYDCICEGKIIFRKFVRAGGHTRGSYYPGVFGLRLRPDLFFKYNPILNKENAMVMEEKLANILRAKGFAVWQH